MSKIPKLVDSSTQTERPKLEFQKLKSIEILPSVKPIKISSIPKEPKDTKESTESKKDQPENDFGSAEELEECLNKEEELNQIKSIDFEKGITTIDEILEVHDDPNTKLEEFIKNHPSKSEEPDRRRKSLRHLWEKSREPQQPAEDHATDQKQELLI